ncbi:MAG: DUF3750 domain-containing protein [Thalassobaculaceae bacterium]
MIVVKAFCILLILLFLGPLLALGGDNRMGKAWWQASRESAGLAPDANEVEDAIVQVYAARAFSWRGALGVHTWISTKRTLANYYTVYHLVGWRLRRGDDPVVIQQDIPDRLWYDSKPEILVDVRGDGVDAIIERIDTLARSYPYRDDYTLWPGPNSNTFTAWIARQVPELKLDLPPTAIGKDWLGSSNIIDKAPSGTGYQFSIWGLFGILVGKEEGIEINIAGLNFGIDFKDIGVRLPGLGNIVVRRSHNHTTIE